MQWEEVEFPVDENILLCFNERIVTFIRVIGQLSPNKASYIILLTVLMTDVYSIDERPHPTVFGRF